MNKERKYLRQVFVVVVLSLASLVASTTHSWAQTGRLSGTVSDNMGNKIAGVTITAIDANTSQTQGSTVTDANGFYSLTLPVGTYNLQVVPPAGSGYASRTINGVIVGAGDTTLNITLVLSSGVQLSGRVTDRDGNPVANLEIYLKHAGTTIASTTDLMPKFCNELDQACC